MTAPARPLPGDARSVGELLRDADITARAALWDPNPDQAKARVRGWGSLLDAAWQLWDAIPDQDRDPVMDRITRPARTTGPSAAWPGAGPSDPLLQSAADSIRHAAMLVQERRLRIPPLTPEGAADAAAARTRLMHTIYAASHAVALSLGHHVRDLQRRLEAGRSIPAGESLVRARAARDRATLIERLAGGYLENRWPTAFEGEHQDRPVTSRLGVACARWDLAAHRVLAHQPSMANLATVVRGQAGIVVAAKIVDAAAARTGALDHRTHEQRIEPATTRLERTWTRLDKELHQMLGQDRRRDPQLIHAGNELHAALREITHQHNGLATPHAMAARSDLTAVTRILHHSVAASGDLAQAVRDTLQDPGLVGNARGVHSIATELLGPDPDTPWVNPADIANHREVALPQPLRAALFAHTDRVILSARVVDSATSALHEPRGTMTAGQPAITSGRQHQDRALPPTGHAAPAIGCER